jgi:hypothetical protein
MYTPVSVEQHNDTSLEAYVRSQPKPLITVVIPRHEAPMDDYQRTLLSINIQTLKAFCKIIIPDVPGWSNKIHLGFSFVKTNWFFILNDDDLIGPNCLEECWKAHLRTGYRIVSPTPGHEGVPTAESVLASPHPYAALIHKDVWNQLGGYHDVPFADRDFWIRCHIAGIPVACTPENHFTWVQRPGQDTERLKSSGEWDKHHAEIQEKYGYLLTSSTTPL